MPGTAASSCPVARSCPVCGQRFAGGAGPDRCPNRWCRRPDRGFSVAFAAGVHRGDLRRAIARYKYRGERRLCGAFADMVARYVTDRAPWFEEFDMVTAVPAYLGPGSRRTWDPVGAVLQALPDRLGPGWAVEPGLVAKTAETPGMAGRGWAERQRIAQGPLRRSLLVPDPAAVRGAQILVLDDVLTEGSTLREVALALRRAGASDVAGLVIGRPAWAPGRGPLSMVQRCPKD